VKKRKSNESTIKEAIDRLLKAYKLEDRMNEFSVIERWEKIMGKPIALRTEEIYITNKVLIVKVNSSVMRSELQNARSKIIKMINEDAGKEIITNVLFS
jgi:predicted nucleic acid-binding Zn ribbon protein